MGDLRAERKAGPGKRGPRWRTRSLCGRKVEDGVKCRRMGVRTLSRIVCVGFVKPCSTVFEKKVFPFTCLHVWSGMHFRLTKNYDRASLSLEKSIWLVFR
jgi:hypothetical protein